jgi:4'-phosphopantetheinyl transferase
MNASTLWLLPPQNILLADDEVHVWCGFLDLSKSIIHKFMNFLSADEQIRANRFYFLKDKNRFVAARGMLRKLLSCYLGVEPNDVHFQYSQHGKPSLHPDMDVLKLPICASKIKFNVSHSNKIALFGFTKFREIGIDVEYVQHLPDADKIAKRFFSPQENLIYQELTKKQAAFYHCWTRKEAFIKAIGEGLSYPLDKFEVSFLPNDEPCIKHINGDKNQGKRWSLKGLEPYPGYIGAIAVEGKNLRFITFEFQTSDSNNLRIARQYPSSEMENEDR